MTQYDAFLRDIIDHPDDDTPRLVYADWLDQQSEAVFAGAADAARDQRLAVWLRRIIASPADDAPRLEYAAVCEAYGQPERAEFVRLQCRIADLDRELMDDEDCGSKDCPGCQERNALRRRERELLGAHGREWVQELLPEALVSSWSPHDSNPYLCLPGEQFVTPAYRRGFVAEVTCTLPAWMGERCRDCNGRLASQAYPICTTCHGPGRLPGIGARLVRAAPLVSVRLSDREPWHDRGLWYWGDETMPRPNYAPEACALPQCLHRHCKGAHRTRQSALDALSRALLAWAHLAAEQEDVRRELARIEVPVAVRPGTPYRDVVAQRVDEAVNSDPRVLALRARLRELDALLN